MKQILIAGIGNIFQGDDAFGCEAIRQLAPKKFPPGVTVMDFGIRSYDLAYALNGGYDVIILVDTTSRGQPPGTLYLIELKADRADGLARTEVDAHTMNPLSVIQMAQSLGGLNGKLYLVGCEPEVLESDELGLSLKVQEAIPEALNMIASIVNDILATKEEPSASLEPA